MKSLYENIKKYRCEKKMTQAELAKLTGYTDRSSIAKIENGEIDLPESKIQLFSKALQVPLPNLMGWASEYADALLDYYDDTIKKISKLFRNNGYSFYYENYSFEPLIVIESSDHRFFHAVYEADLLSLFEEIKLKGENVTFQTLFDHISNHYAPDEAALLADFNKLNPIGRSEARKRVSELTYIPDYTKDTASSDGTAG